MADKTIFMVEDEVLLSELFQEYIEMTEGLRFIGHAADGKTGIRQCLEKKPDIIVLDLRVPEMSGLEVLKLFADQLPTAAVIVYTGSLSEETLRICLENNAAAYVEKASGLADLQQALDAVLQGEKFFSPGVKSLLKTFRL